LVFHAASPRKTHSESRSLCWSRAGF